MQQSRNVRFLKFNEFYKDFIHVHLICKFQDDSIKSELVILMIKSNIDFFNTQGNENQNQNDPTWPGFQLIPDFIHVHLICKKGKRKVQGVPQSQTAALPRPQDCKFQEDPIKTERVMLMKKSN